MDVPTNNRMVADILEERAIPAWLQPNGKKLQQDQSTINLQPTADGGYTGILHFYFDAMEDDAAEPEPHTVEIHVQRTTQRFGQDERKVWKVYLCDVDALWNQE